MSAPRTPHVFFIALGSILLICSACNSNGSPDAVSTASSINLPFMGVVIISASPTDCPAGGSTIKVFRDLKGTGVFDSSDPILSSTNVCNGQQGAQGVGAGIEVTTAPQASCPAGGSILTTFIDPNNNGTLDPGESVTSATTICNGTNGTNGADGSSAHLTEVAATSAQCATGGVVYTTWTGNAQTSQTVVCNGLNGQNATQLQMGAVGPAVAHQAFSACHHDYLYIPDNSDGSRGWLTFRHQENGSADQGIGSTGFNVWNVDISDFLLVSEDQSVTYCSLHWNPTAKTLSYTVVDSADGFQGYQGTIQFH